MQSSTPSSDEGHSTGQRGKKRKRQSANDDKQAAAESSATSVHSSIHERGRLLLTILRFLTSLVSLASECPPALASQAKDQIHLILKSNDSMAAKIVGAAYRHASSCLSQSQWRESGQFGGLESLLVSLPVLQVLWDCRDDRSTSEKNAAATGDPFAVHALPESLMLLQALRDLPASLTSQKARLQQIIEGNIALLFVLPMRTSFMLQPNSGAADGKPASDHCAFLTACLRDALQDRENDLHDDMLPLLFELFVRSVARDTYKKRTQEAPWLEAVFCTLAARCGCSTSVNCPAPPTHTPASTQTLVHLLDVAIERKVHISLPILCRLAQRYAGLDESSSCVNWRLTANLLRLSKDIVLPNSGVQGSKEMLAALITGISTSTSQERSHQDDQYDLVKTEVILPLIRGFADARDLATFTAIWTEQLFRVPSTRLLDYASNTSSIWEEQAIVLEYRSAMQTEAVPQLLEQVKGLFSNLRNPGAGRASAVLLDALLPLAGPHLSSPDGSQYFIILQAALQEGESFQARLWSLACHFAEIMTLAVSLGEAQVTEAVGLAASRISTALARPPLTQSCDEVIEAFQFVSLSTNTFATNPAVPAALCAVVDCVVDLLHRLRDSNGVTAGSSSHASGRAYVRQLALILLSNPATFAVIPRQTRRSLFQGLLAFETSGTHEHDTTPTGIWTLLTSPESAQSATCIVQDTVAVVLDKYGNENQVAPTDIAALASIPAGLIPHHQRVSIIDLLHDCLLSKHQLPVPAVVQTLSLMTQLIELPKSSNAKIISSAADLWTLAQALPPASVEAPLDEAICRLVDRTMVRVSALSEIHQQQIMRTLAKSVLKATFPPPVDEVTKATFLVGVLAVKVLVGSQALALLKEKQKTQVQDRMEVIVSFICDSLSAARRHLTSGRDAQDQEQGASLSRLLLCLQKLDTSAASKKARKAIAKIDDSDKLHEARYLNGVLLKQCRLQSQDLDDIDGVAASLRSCYPELANGLRNQKARSIMKGLSSILTKLEQEHVCHLLQRVLQADVPGKHEVGALSVAGLLCSVLRPTEERDGVVFKTTSVAFSDFCHMLSHCSSIEAFCLIMETLDLLLHTQTRCLTQWNIDNLIGCLSVVVSSSAMLPSSGGALAQLIFTRICRVLAMVFGQYRQKLSGRMHLVVTLMQRLLRCLFIYEATPGAVGVTHARVVKITSTLPTWITAHSDCEVTREPACAVQYTRLLTLLCDPTVSAVQRPTGTQGLNGWLTDNTKKVKSLAGQHLQYVVLEFAVCSLRARLQPVVRAALMPGLYAILDVMSQDGLKGMNASMDAPTRAMFRGLYEDYKRYGRWTHD
ncbi:hypothetical protein KEM52_003864 [Ascosphaera acerosa]|nr:hypothetical protein KEM52_003864 [Ascosphaera acerosa]